LYRLGAVDATIGAELRVTSAPKSNGEGRENLATENKIWRILAKKGVLAARNQCRPMRSPILARHVR
jgi:hypothetical protein